jgi:dCMP deaminase
MTRPSRDDFWFGIAAKYAERATCPRASIGAVLVKFDRIIGAGFNGAPPGLPHCLERNQTLRQHLEIDHCAWAVHAERNAVYNTFIQVDGATLYVVGPRPICPDCRDYLASRGVTDIRHRPSVTTLDGLFRDANTWQAATFPRATPASVAEHLRREVAELAADPTDTSELADVVFLAIGLAYELGVDLKQIVAAKLTVNMARTWGKPDADGVVEHVREVPA